MRIIPKLRVRKTKNKESPGAKSAPAIKKSLSRVIFSVFWAQRKFWASLAAILVTFAFLEFGGQSPFKDTSQRPRLFKQEASQILADIVPTLSASQMSADNFGLLGGPVESGSLQVPAGQASIDMTADDAIEDTDLMLVQENAVASPTNPTGTLTFFGFKKDVTNYVVKPGDVPEQIAASLGINSDTLLWANGLRDGDIIKPGQTLLVLPINGVRVKVGAKDTIDALAKKYNGDKMEIIAFNELPLDGQLTGGQYIIIPDGEMPASTKQPRYVVPSNKYAASTIPAGWLIIPTTGHDWGRIHASDGVDIANVCGTPVYAAAAGEVILADSTGWNGGYGKYIKIMHSNGVITLYGHSSQLLVSEGQEVAQGQLIMLMGTTGRSTGCHLHFEVRGASNPLAGKPRNY